MNAALTHAEAALNDARTVSETAAIVAAIVATCTPEGGCYWVLYCDRAARIAFQDDNPFVGRNYSIEFYEPPTEPGIPWDGFDFNAPLSEWDCVSEWENCGAAEIRNWLRPLVHADHVYNLIVE